METNVVWTIILACSIPATLFGAFVGILIWHGQRKAIKREQERLEREKDRDEMFLLVFEGTSVAISLGKCNAEAYRDGKCNGNVTKALSDVADFRKRQDLFFKRKGIEHLSGNLG